MQGSFELVAKTCRRRPARAHKRLAAALSFALSFPLGASCAAAQALRSGGPAALPDAPMPQQAPGVPAPAQRTGHASISGVVSDFHGGLVPGATVTLTEKEHDVEVVTSGADGSFHFLSLPAGTYNVVIAAPGLDSFLSSPIALRPEEHYELPDIALPIAPTTQTVNVVMTEAQIADQELKEETKQRVLGIFPNFYTSFLWDAAPLNAKQKFRLSLRTVTDPIAFVGSAVVAGIETGRDTFPDWGQDAPSYGKRFAAAYGDQLFGRILGSAFYPTIFRQDPRYFWMGPNHPFRQRLKHALLAGVEARGDNGKWQPNYSHVMGNATAGALSTVYHPASNSAGELALANALIGVIGGSVQGLVREFVTVHLTRRAPYAQGKPKDVPPAAPPAPPQPPAVPASGGSTSPAVPSPAP